MRQHCTPTRIAKMKRLTIPNVTGMQNNWNPYIVIIEGKIMQPLWDIVWQYLKMLNVNLLYNRNSTSYLPRKWRHIPTSGLYMTIHISLMNNNQKLGTTQVSINWLMDLIWHIQTKATTDVYNKIDELQKHHATLKARYKNYMLYNFTFKEISRKGKTIETK